MSDIKNLRYVVAREYRETIHTGSTYIVVDEGASIADPKYFEHLGTYDTVNEAKTNMDKFIIADGKEYNKHILENGVFNFPNIDDHSERAIRQRYGIRNIFVYFGEDFTVNPGIYYVPMYFYIYLRNHVQSIGIPATENIIDLKDNIIIRDDIQYKDLITKLNLREHILIYQSESGKKNNEKSEVNMDMSVLILQFGHLRHGNSKTMAYYTNTAGPEMLFLLYTVLMSTQMEKSDIEMAKSFIESSKDQKVIETFDRFEKMSNSQDKAALIVETLNSDLDVEDAKTATDYIQSMANEFSKLIEDV